MAQGQSGEVDNDSAVHASALQPESQPLDATLGAFIAQPGIYQPLADPPTAMGGFLHNQGHGLLMATSDSQPSDTLSQQQQQLFNSPHTFSAQLVIQQQQQQYGSRGESSSLGQELLQQQQYPTGVRGGAQGEPGGSTETREEEGALAAYKQWSNSYEAQLVRHPYLFPIIC